MARKKRRQNNKEKRSQTNPTKRMGCLSSKFSERDLQKHPERKANGYEKMQPTKAEAGPKCITLLCYSSKQEHPKREANVLKEEKQGEMFDACKAIEGEGEGGSGSYDWRQKTMARELVSMKVPAAEFMRTGSLRDWLHQESQVLGFAANMISRRVSREDPVEEEGCEEGFDEELVS
ncbi:hypothetical protein HPP92_018301 [Vanilla planifolia]|uniref:Uncharacterized protein n=1 Tax=Vanilla planifolia TaxID=51239 RepID=A0A835QCP9_VANPL|nr:hypothetical protein HPP92_018301 [Vanilla planifolia]